MVVATYFARLVNTSRIKSFIKTRTSKYIFDAEINVSSVNMIPIVKLKYYNSIILSTHTPSQSIYY